MELGIIGMGKMGSNMSRRLILGGHTVFAFDTLKEAMKVAANFGAKGTESVSDMVKKLTRPRVIWIMVPSGKPIESTISILVKNLSPGDIIIDGGNSHYKDSMRRANILSQNGIYFLDVGTSGGIWGLKEGYCLMIGGETKAFKQVEPIFQTLAPSSDKGYGHVGPSGAGHFVKMVHNGIEYGLMEAYAEGFELMQAKQEFKLDLPKIAEIWRYGSVIRSWLLDLTFLALTDEPDLRSIKAHVEDSGEGRWVVKESIDLAVPTPVIAQSLQVRFRSRQEQSFGSKILAVLRKQFGGHGIEKI